MPSQSSAHQFSKLLDGRGLELDEPMRVGVKAGGWDDAIHIAKTRRSRLTLCGLDAPSRNIVTRVEGRKVDGGAGCWTCLGELKNA
jgi:hypothetical protein